MTRRQISSINFSAALWAALLLCVLTVGRVSPAWAIDDNENDRPTAWWLYTGQALSDIESFLSQNTARLIDLQVESTLNTYTVTYVGNTGTYAKAWWYYAGIDITTLANHISANQARLTSLQAYDSGGGTILYNATMIANTGADAKSWWYYVDQSAADIATTTQNNNARLTTLESYQVGGQTVYADIMIANTGADAKGWYYYVDVSPQAISTAITQNKARIIDLTYAGGSNFNVIMESCATGCPIWWWYEGNTPLQTYDFALSDEARPLTTQPYPGCGGNCFASVMINDLSTAADSAALGTSEDFFDERKSGYSVWRPSTGFFYSIDGSGKSLSQQWGLSTDVPVAGDFDGDGRTDLAVFRPSNGYWYIVQSSDGEVVSKQWGASTDIPLTGDFDGDGKSDIAVWRPSTGYWYVVQSYSGEVKSTQWGASTDIPVTGDFDGDGKTDVAVWRPSTGYWYILKSGSGAVTSTQWGASTDIPVTGDFDGDGITDIAVYRPSTGYWYIIQSSNGAVITKQWGESGDIPVARDYDGDGTTDIAVFRPSTGDWYVIQSSTGNTVTQQWGASTDIPLNKPQGEQ